MEIASGDGSIRFPDKLVTPYYVKGVLFFIFYK